MNKLKNPIIAAIAIGLLGGSALGASAQSGDVDSTTPAFVTGSIVGGQTVPTETQSAEEGFTRIEVVSGPDVWETSDRRLSGDVTYHGVWHRYPAPAAMQVEAATYDLVNSGGRWLGQATAVATATLDGWDTIVFKGEGDYEGLTAYVVIDWDAGPVFTGAIMPGDMPAFPEQAATE